MPVIDVFALGVARDLLPLLQVPAFFGSTLLLPLLLFLVVRDLRASWGGILVAIALSLGCTLVLQELSGRVRPDALLSWWPAPPTPSCPSGHAALAMALAVLWGLQRRSRAVGAFLLAAWIGASRVALGHHYLTDVLLGGVLGAGAGVTAWGWSEGRGPRRWGWGLGLQVALVVVISIQAWMGLVPGGLFRLPGMDKALHALLFGLVAFWGTLLSGGRRAAVVVPFGLAFTEEMAQSLSPLRSCDPVDLLADLSGMVLFHVLARWILRAGAGPGRVLDAGRATTSGCA